jgi:hypothetical protein
VQERWEVTKEVRGATRTAEVRGQQEKVKE